MHDIERRYALKRKKLSNPYSNFHDKYGLDSPSPSMYGAEHERSIVPENYK